MAKKVKKVEKEDVESSSAYQEKINALIADRITRLETELNQRIDRIVDAHEHCKSLRGL